MASLLRKVPEMENISNGYSLEEARHSITPLPPVLSRGLSAVSFFGFLSLISSLSLFIYLTYKLVSWQLRPLPPEQKLPPIPPPPTAEIAATSSASNLFVPSAYLCPDNDDSTSPNTGSAQERQTKGMKPRSLGEWLRREPPNQFLMLIYNLLLADIQQSLAFTINVAWLKLDKVDAESPACWLQGWFVSTGDLASSLFISAIAVHTYLGVVKGYRPRAKVFYVSISILWAFNYGTAGLGVIIDGTRSADGGLYVRAGAWCWINSAHQDLRLHLHYVWIFLSLILTSAIYLYIVYYLHMHRTAHSLKCSLSSPDRLMSEGQNVSCNREADLPPPNTPTSISSGSGIQAMNTTSHTTDPADKNTLNVPEWPSRHPTFLLYPIIYVLCTAPLAFGRLATFAGANVPFWYFCFAGSMIASAGWLDVALYSSTRHSIVFSGEAPPTQDTGLETFTFMRTLTPFDRRLGNVVTIVSGGGARSKEGKKEKTADSNRENFWSRWSGKAASPGREGGGGEGIKKGRDCLRVLTSSIVPFTKIGQGAEAGKGAKNSIATSTKGKSRKDDGGGRRGITIQCEIVTSVSVEFDESKVPDASSLTVGK